ncbi:EAL domain-containing protein [Sulfurospirillum barnesii]|uniref:PAS domain S-box/diguanylate cyclase (GGDEF) domain-containing protein n=1 Tax=Sulfurospirillum barnesii (strain ATCC 700032 / DSM 10660 / SES-3) TaxID=760154 RepID=I3XUI6_SULBS|nr:EAL domain-containing protein [Sulfurospirillum barnesii]AFL67610.1 PAS domain S-box/diguanylate cyclase (GGDEF) domain-containing protein [Sulfurospirillum barnesii SES-3]
MKLTTYRYESLEALEAFLTKTFPPDAHLFIQLFCGNTNHQILQPLLECLKSQLSNSVIIGTSTTGEISSGCIHTSSIQISFCHLQKSRAKAYYFAKADFESGQKAAQKLIEKETRVCISFAYPFGEDNSENFLEGFNSVCSHVPIAGGNASDEFLFSDAFIICENHIYTQGIVLVGLSGKSLHVNHKYSLGWIPIGKEMCITKAHHNSVYEIDHQPVQAIYQHYLGAKSVQNLPFSAMEFPFMKICDGMEVYRSLIGVNPDGSLLYAGHLHEGDRVRFAIGNIEEIMHKALLLQQAIDKKPTEALFIYSCSARKVFLQEHLAYECELLEQIAPTAGFFSYGEFFHTAHHHQLLNLTTTVLGLSESDFIVSHTATSKPEVVCSTLKSLTHLVNVTQHELDLNTNFLSQYKNVLDACCIVSKMDCKGVITYVNEAFREMSGYSYEEIIGQTHRIFRPSDADLVVYENLWNTIRQKKIWKGITRGIDKKGAVHYLQNTVMPILDAKGEILEYICAHFSITELVLKDQIIEKHFKDELTGFGNREALFYRLSLHEKKQLLILFNVVGFSEINDYLGYDVGDALLKNIAQFLMHSFQEHLDVVFRTNGDEFAVLLSHYDFEESLLMKERIKKIVHELEKKVFTLYGYDVLIRLNVGVAQELGSKVYRCAHIALKEAKRENQLIVFYNTNHALKKRTTHNLQIIQKIKRAIEHDRIVPFYQGIYDNAQQKITKYEVLMRLMEEDGTYLSPYFFLEQAKKTRLYEKLTKIMIQKAFAYLKDFDVDFSINFTKGDILSSSVKECLYETIKKYQCGHRVILEIVESEGIENFSEIIHFIHEVKKLGCRIAIDDFGTGYSNFTYLVKLDVDFIKIDGSIIKAIATNEVNRMMTQTIVSFAHKMGYEVVAEFVDNPQVQAILEELHVNFSQGYLFSKPSALIHQASV